MKTILFAAVCLFTLTATAPAAPDATATYQADNVTDLLTTYGKLTGKKILLDAGVQGKIGFIASVDENVDRKVELIEKILFLNGFALVDVGDDVVAVLGLGKSVRSVGVPLYTKPEELPTGQRVFSYLFKLAHRDPVEVAALLAQYIPPNISTGFAPDRASQSLIVTGQTSVIRQLIKLVAALDVPREPVDKPADQKPVAEASR